MIKPSALIMAIAMAAVTTGTYYGLDLLPPGVLPPPIGRVARDEPPAPGVKPATQEVASAAPAAAAEPAPAPADQPVTEQDLAEEPPPPEPAPQAQAQAAPEPEPAAEPEPAPAQPAPKPYTPPPALVDEPVAAKPKPAPAKPKKEVTIVREDSEPTQTASAEAPKASKPRPPEADVIKPWWPDSSKLPANQLKLQYAGQVQGEQAIALLFSAPLNIETIKQHAQVKTESGQAVQGGWELGKNPRLAVFRGVQSGRYTVILAPQVADAKGFMLGQTLKGPVYIQPPTAQ